MIGALVPSLYTESRVVCAHDRGQEVHAVTDSHW